MLVSTIPFLFLNSCSRRVDPSTDWPAVKQMVREKFPGVPQLSTKELASMKLTSRPLLLDARSPEEFAVSHLQDAELASDEEQALDVLKDVGMDRPIV